MQRDLSGGGGGGAAETQSAPCPALCTRQTAGSGKFLGEPFLGSATTKGNSGAPSAPPNLKHPKENPKAGLFYGGEVSRTTRTQPHSGLHPGPGNPRACGAPEPGHGQPGWAAWRASSSQQGELRGGGGGAGEEGWGTQGTPQCRAAPVMWVLGDSGSVLTRFPFHTETHLNPNSHPLHLQGVCCSLTPRPFAPFAPAAWRCLPPSPAALCPLPSTPFFPSLCQPGDLVTHLCPGLLPTSPPDMSPRGLVCLSEGPEV